MVEDDALVRGYVIAELGGLGYRTLVASDGAAALGVVDQGAESDFLFTEVIMPGGMNGRQLAEAVVARRPGIKVLDASGYTDDAIVHEGHPQPRPGPAQKAIPESRSGAEDPRGARQWG